MAVELKSSTLEVVSRFRTLDCGIDGAESLREVNGKGPGLKRIESLVKLLYLGDPEYHSITILSIQDAMECCPSHRSRMPIDAMLLRGISNSSHRCVHRSLSIEAAVYLSDNVLAIR